VERERERGFVEREKKNREKKNRTIKAPEWGQQSRKK
jgi:hypothetical protein